MRGRLVVTVVFFRKWFCLGAFSTQHRLCSLRLLASNVGRPGYSEFVQLVLKRAAQEQIKNRRHATGSALKFGSKVALILFQVQTVPWGVVKFHCVGSHAFLWESYCFGLRATLFAHRRASLVLTRGNGGLARAKPPVAVARQTGGTMYLVALSAWLRRQRMPLRPIWKRQTSRCWRHGRATKHRCRWGKAVVEFASSTYDLICVEAKSWMSQWAAWNRQLKIETEWLTFQLQPSVASLPPSCRYSVEVWNWGAQTVSPITSTCHLPITVGIATSLHFNWKCASFCFPLSTSVGMFMCFMFARGHSPAARSLETDELERAGADFMLHCFRRQMNGTYSRSSTWSLPSQIPDLADTEAKFQEEMENFLQRNASNHLLLHIDELRSMSTSPEFRREHCFWLAHFHRCVRWLPPASNRRI